MSKSSLGNRTIVVTGASSGIGLATAQRVAADGARVIMIARGPEKLQAAIATLSGEGHESHAIDVTLEREMADLLKGVRERCGAVHGIVCCAGAHMVRPLAISTADNFAEQYRSNVIGTVNTVRPLLRAVSAEGASIVFLSSVAGLRGSASASAYAAAKGALIALGKSLAVELAGKRIRVNVVVPGVVETPMSERFLGTLPEEHRQGIVRAHPLGLGKPTDVAGAILFLLSDDARWITGSEIVVDGGLSSK
jgi:NAD(P)-dependent dehydrogenase (short-subunit alcohol dehydrogenase family)